MPIALAEYAMLGFAHLRARIKRSMGAKRIWIAAGPLVPPAVSAKCVLRVPTVCPGYAILACVRLFPPARMASRMAGKPISIVVERIACRAALGTRASWGAIARAFRACKTFALDPRAATAFKMAVKSPLIADPHVPLAAQQERRVSFLKIVRAKNAKVPQEIRYAANLRVSMAFGMAMNRITTVEDPARNVLHCIPVSSMGIAAVTSAIQSRRHVHKHALTGIRIKGKRIRIVGGHVR